MWNTKLCLVLACSYLIFAQNTSAAVLPQDERNDLISSNEKQNIDQLVDFFMTQFAGLAKSEKLDPLSIPDISTKFEKKILFVTFKAGAFLKNGKIVGVSSLYRTGNCTLIQGDTNITVTADLGVKAMMVSFRGEAYAFSETVKVGVDINAKVKNLRIRAVATQGNEMSSKATLKEFAIKSLDFDVNVSGLGPLGWIASKLLALVKKIFKTKLTILLTIKVRDLIASKLQTFHLPFGY